MRLARLFVTMVLLGACGSSGGDDVDSATAGIDGHQGGVDAHGGGTPDSHDFYTQCPPPASPSCGGGLGLCSGAAQNASMGLFSTMCIYCTSADLDGDACEGTCGLGSLDSNCSACFLAGIAAGGHLKSAYDNCMAN